MLGIPTHLAPRVNAWSMVRAFHTAAIGALAVAAAIVSVSVLDDSARHLLSVIGALLVTAALVAVHARRRTRVTAAVLLVVGAAATWWTGFAVARAELPSEVASALASLTIIPLVLIGGNGSGLGRMIWWTIIGFAVGRVATTLGSIQGGGSYQRGILAWVTLALSIGVVVAGSRISVQARRVQPELLRSAREEHVSAYRQRIELEAAAILHDTVLSHLNAIAMSPSGFVDPGLIRAVDDDFAMLTRRDWLAGPVPPRAERSEADRFTRMLDSHRTPASAAEPEFAVKVSGDLSVLDGLDEQVLTALIGAVGQCLANVRKHADTDQAEVSVFDDGRSCTVMVVDDGRGFDEQSTGADRLGLKNSVRQRVERVGGEMQLWSAPGNGTSIMLTVPLDVDLEQAS